MLSEHPPCLVGGINTLDDTSFATKIVVHDGANALAPFGCMVFLDTDSSQIFTRRDVSDSMLSVGGASAAYERKFAPPSWSGFAESVPLPTSTSVCLSVHLFRADEPMCSLMVWAYVAPPSGNQHAVLLYRDSWMRFNNRSYRSLPPRLSGHRMFGELEPSHDAPAAGVHAYAIDPVASGGGFHFRYDGVVGVTLSDGSQVLAVNLVRRKGSQALTWHYLVNMLPQSDLPAVETGPSPR